MEVEQPPPHLLELQVVGLLLLVVVVAVLQLLQVKVEVEQPPPHLLELQPQLFLVPLGLVVVLQQPQVEVVVQQQPPSHLAEQQHPVVLATQGMRLRDSCRRLWWCRYCCRRWKRRLNGRETEAEAT